MFACVCVCLCIHSQVYADAFIYIYVYFNPSVYPSIAFIICTCVLVAQSCLILWDPRDRSPQDPLSIEFSRQEYWSGLPFPLPGESSQRRDQTWASCIAGNSLPSEPPGKPCIYSPYSSTIYWKLLVHSDASHSNPASQGSVFSISMFVTLFSSHVRTLVSVPLRTFLRLVFKMLWISVLAITPFPVWVHSHPACVPGFPQGRPSSAALSSPPQDSCPPPHACPALPIAIGLNWSGRERGGWSPSVDFNSIHSLNLGFMHFPLAFYWIICANILFSISVAMFMGTVGP